MILHLHVRTILCKIQDESNTFREMDEEMVITLAIKRAAKESGRSARTLYSAVLSCGNRQGEDI
jgi:hypothetical protein